MPWLPAVICYMSVMNRYSLSASYDTKTGVLTSFVNLFYTRPTSANSLAVLPVYELDASACWARMAGWRTCEGQVSNLGTARDLVIITIIIIIKPIKIAIKLTVH